MVGGMASVGWGRSWEKGVRQLIWCKYCVHIYVNVKMRPVESITGMVEGGKKVNDERDEFDYNIYDML
jgi:hypothetical protein